MSAAKTRIAAERVVVASPQAVFTFLGDLENHWLLADRFVEVLTLDRPAEGAPAYGGTVMMRGPLGLGRTVRTRVVEMHPDSSLAGTAFLGNGTEAMVQWTLMREAGGTRVRLEASVQRAGRLETVFLAAGGRRWLQRRFASILQTLARRLSG